MNRNFCTTITKPTNCHTSKTTCRGFANAIIDSANSLCQKIIKNNDGLYESLQTTYTLSYLISKSVKQDEIIVQNVRSSKKYQNGMSFDSIRSFDFRINLDDCNIVLRVNNMCARLYIEGVYASTLRCPNGAYIYILKELYSQAQNMGVAA